MSAGACFFVAAAGHWLRAQQIGRWEADDPVLVLLHEGLGSIGQWHGFPAALAGACGLPALVYERYGHGGSDPLVGERPANFIEVEAREALPAVLEATGIRRPVLFGHSDGGTIALLYASAFASRPVAVVTEAAHVLVEATTHASLVALKRRWDADEGFRRRLARHHGDRTEAMFRGWAESWTRPENRQWQMLDRLPAIRCPVLAVQGEDDAHGTPAQVAEIVGRVGGPATALMIPGCGHVPHREQEAIVLARVGTFVRAAVSGDVAAREGATARARGA